MDRPIYRQEGSTLIIQPYINHLQRVKIFCLIGILFLFLALFLWFRFSDFWQLPTSIGLCLSLLSLGYYFYNIQMKVVLDKGNSEIYQLIFNRYRINKISFSSGTIVSRSLNGRFFYAISPKSNAYGNASQISPFLTKESKRLQYEQEVLPLIEAFLKK
ncbi:hypothetical protein CEY12_01550 [Chryseobacterium sp. T16E-39]|uniref:hypothetical protein n=1 Tax=Chryseobacterium sp. T16E-39 TaxID=2015076 RepID=UPI000B5B2668|nr:hypothetical protein [Chryseobacterium sp. T16E-39]ASK28871.1 hypothetical protein CEY12_01550 [Chryseobacterium sp. T16E-39]